MKVTSPALSAVVAIGAASARNAVALEAGQRYLVTASAGCHCKQGNSGVTVAAGDAGAFYLPAGGQVVIYVDDAASAFLATVRASVDGTLYIALEEGGRD